MSAAVDGGSETPTLTRPSHVINPAVCACVKSDASNHAQSGNVAIYFQSKTKSDAGNGGLTTFKIKVRKV